MEAIGILRPAIVLVGWTGVMLAWLLATRLPALSKAGIEPQQAQDTSRLRDLLPAEAQRVANPLASRARRAGSVAVVRPRRSIQRQEYPPSTGSVWPVMKEAASLDRKTTAVAISSGLPSRPIGWSCSYSCWI